MLKKHWMKKLFSVRMAVGLLISSSFVMIDGRHVSRDGLVKFGSVQDALNHWLELSKAIWRALVQLILLL